MTIATLAQMVCETVLAMNVYPSNVVEEIPDFFERVDLLV